MSWFGMYLCVVVLTLVLPPPSFSTWQFHRVLTDAKIDPNDKGEPLFKEGHPNITYLTDENYDDLMNKYSDRPWLVDFYHPFCPHCKHFVPTYEEIAAYYKIEGSIYLGAVSCMDHVKCRRVGIKGFPTLMAIGFDKKHPHKETKRVVGTHTFQEVVDFVNENFREAAFNETGTYPPTATPVPRGGTVPESKVLDAEEGEVKGEGGKGEKEAVPGEQVRKEIWEESTKPMNQTTRLQDAASAFIFGLKQGVFMGREVLEDDELDALKAWLKLVSETFPGTINRKIILTLYQKIESLALLDFDRWDAILKTWQGESIDLFEQEELKLDWKQVDRSTIPPWQRLSTLFVGQGVTYRACALYTCGQWNMFHTMTMNPFPDKRQDDLLVSVIATMRRFMKHFFGCVQCRDHFLAYNTIEKVQEIQSSSNKPLALKRWLWKMHNAVNTRIRHPVWPKPSICPTCGDESEWIEVEVDKWLGNTYVYQEVVVPPVVPVHLRTESVKAQEQEPQAPKVESNEEKGEEQLEKELEAMVVKADPIAPTAPTQPKPKPKEVKQQQANMKQPGPILDGQAHVKMDAAQNPKAPPVSLFTWYILPVAAVGAYLLFVRSRKKARTSFRHHARE